MRFDPVPPGVYPDAVHPPYKSTTLRGPLQAPLRIETPLPVNQGIAFRRELVSHGDADLTTRGAAAPLGEKIVVTGRVTDEDGRPVRDSLVEVWQCNSAGRYFHRKDQHDAPLDPNFFGFGKFFTDGDGALSLRDHQARALSLGQSRQGLAAGAHPLLAVRQRLRAAPGHADVLSRRSAAGARSDLQQHPGCGGARAPRRADSASTRR